MALWGDLCRLAISIDGPWHLMGDFNAVLRQHERSGGSSNACIRGDNAFKDFVNRCQLMDIGYNGSPFTWRRGSVFERLDRSLASYEWRIMFPDAFLTHLNPLKSDHAPILLKLLATGHRRRGSKPFRFEAAWLTHESFPAFLQQEWNTHQDWNNRIDHNVKSLLEWKSTTSILLFHQQHRNTPR
ncbi:uncharacterized protein LOC109818021 [Cajanus cajan]|uniref:Endonuclease/exonuclease/phosphatase domain-containing protein n=1 Tax=Cajanus cajan TaxID=3821 RepID=A0A151RK68_CAJCA|nr:uncharacterized protein LOC109818021 [Cajanus cajan]KYP42969.1 hypothetical protein KK1_035590 [Cajanus cajan]